MKKIFVLGTVLSMLLVSGCASNSDTASVDESGLRETTLILDYLPNTNHTGFYVGLDKGYYEEEGIDLEIVQPQEGVTTTLIANGVGDFGISYQEDVTYARSLEEPLPIKAIGAIIQNNTSGFVSAKSKNILTPKDFEGKTYSGWGSPAEEAIIRASMEEYDADFDKVKLVSGYGGIENLEDMIDFIWIFYGWDGIKGEMEGLELNYMSLKDIDERLNYYTPVIIASEETLEDEEYVKAFMRATRRGFEYAIENPEESAEILVKYVPEYDLEFITQSQLYLSQEYMKGTDTFGYMKDEVWRGYLDFMLEYGLIENDFDITQAYTNEFLN